VIEQLVEPEASAACESNIQNLIYVL